MPVNRFQHVGEFVGETRKLLMEQEAQNHLILELCATCQREAGTRSVIPYMAAVTGGKAVLAAAYRSAPHRLVVSTSDEDTALEALAADFSALDLPLPGVTGPSREAGVFARRWSSTTGQSSGVDCLLRVYRMVAAPTAPPVSGRLRPATEDDAEIVEAWLSAFADEALGTVQVNDQGSKANGHAIQGPIFLWERSGEILSMAGHGAPTQNGIRITVAYTPPEHRQQGYSTACLAALTGKMLGEGRRYCLAITDLHDLASSQVFRRVGYRPVCNITKYRFGL